MALRPYTDFIPRNIAWYTPTNWPNVTAAPTNSDMPRQLWRDNAVVWEAQGSGKWWEPPKPLDQIAAREYTVFEFNADGTPALTPLDSPPFLETYQSKSVVDTYREFHFRFPLGVPFTKKVTVPAVQAGNLNFGGTLPGNPYPVEIPTDTVFFVENGLIVGQDYQGFIRENQPPPMTDEQKYAVIMSYGNRTDLTVSQKLGMFRQLLIERKTPVLI